MATSRRKPSLQAFRQVYGCSAFTSRYDSWRYAPADPMPATDRILAAILDMRLPLTFSLDDCAQIARILRAEISAVHQQG